MDSFLLADSKLTLVMLLAQSLPVVAVGLASLLSASRARMGQTATAKRVLLMGLALAAPGYLSQFFFRVHTLGWKAGFGPLTCFLWTVLLMYAFFFERLLMW